MSSRKAIQPLLLCVQEVMEEGHQHLNEEAVRQIFEGVLRAIHVHGQHAADLDVLSDLAVTLYEKFWVHFPALRMVSSTLVLVPDRRSSLAHPRFVFQVLLSLPDASAKHLAEFEEVLRRNESASAKKLSKQNKFKRDSFKKVVQNVSLPRRRKGLFLRVFILKGLRVSERVCVRRVGGVGSRVGEQLWDTKVWLQREEIV